MNVKIKYLLIGIVIGFLLILFVPPNAAAFSCNTLKNKDLHCHVVGMTFFGIPFQTSIYHWFEWNDPLPCGGVKAHPDKMYPCIGITDYWGYPPVFSPFAELTDFESEQIVCDPGGVVLEDGYCYKDGKRIEFENIDNKSHPRDIDVMHR